MNEEQNHSGIILASKSPRRRFLLENAGIPIQVCPSLVQESDFTTGEPSRYVKTLARAKAGEVADRHPDRWVLGADSIVWAGGRIMEKPGSEQAARAMMKELSGRTHRVYTGYSLICRKRGHLHADVVETAVTFKTLAPEEIAWYSKTSEPYDKAGGYAIQGLGSFMIRAINGSYTNVVGLPLCEVMEHLLRHGVIIPVPGNRQWQTAPMEDTA
ncbi:MAG: Maf family protein [Desulfosalsimonadaceae bacterium]